MKSSNPFFSKFEAGSRVTSGAEQASVSGTALKTMFLSLIVLIAGGFSWQLAAQDPGKLALLSGVGLVGGLVTAFITIFKNGLAPYTAPLYAAFEGLALGAISLSMEVKYPGLALQASGLTVLCLFAMTILYSSGFLRATPALAKGVMSGMMALLVLYFGSMLLGFFGIHLPISSGPLGIIIGLVAVTLACLSLIIDFGRVEDAVSSRAPKSSEWYLAFGLLVTLVWLYVEILRLVSNLRRD